MNFFDSLFGRSPIRSAVPDDVANADPFAGHGFVYHETLNSPNGGFKILNGYSGGEKGPTIVESKVAVAETGRVLFDLWHTYQNCSIQFSDDDSSATLQVQNVHNGLQRDVTINFINETFAFKNNPAVWHPLAKLPELISTF